ncbi:hypothetical protein LCGC14_1574690 [marine sediment metagenome]|uniref:Uncharacterized protein n=1 Tax=marine sediment metagenome TaxID=412755 RepID=A0A0F9IIR1_9ZZZZ
MKSVFRTIMVKLAKQRNTSPHIGAVLNVYSATGIIYAPLTLIGVSTTLYGLWGAELIRAWFPWFTVFHMIGLMVLLILVMMVVFYKVIIPSQIAFGMQQNYKHRNPLVADVQKILRKLESIEKRLEKLENK